MIFGRETVETVWHDALPLMRQHALEVPVVPGLEANPSRPMFELLERSGAMVIFTSRLPITWAPGQSGAAEGPRLGALTGYAVFCVAKSPLYPDVGMFAEQIVLYVLPAYRGSNAIRFLRWQDERLTALGCAVVLRHSTRHSEYGNSLERMGYDAHDHGYIRRANA